MKPPLQFRPEGLSLCVVHQGATDGQYDVTDLFGKYVKSLEMFHQRAVYLFDR